MKANEHAATRRTVRSRHIRDTAGFPPIRLTQRDTELLSALAEYRLLTTSQIHKLFFRSLHRTRKRLFKLWQHKLVDRLFRPISLGERPSDVIYALAPLGARLLTRRKGLTQEAMPKARHVKKFSSLFLDHTLAVNDFRISMKASCDRNDSTKFLFWRQGPGIRFVQVIADARLSGSLLRVPVVADGFVGVETLGKKTYFFVEIDLCTIALNRWRRRFAAYRKASMDDRLLRDLGIPAFGVLVVTTGENRMQNLIKACQPYFPLNGRGILFNFMTMKTADDHLDEVLSGRVWSSRFAAQSSMSDSVVDSRLQ